MKTEGAYGGIADPQNNSGLAPPNRASSHYAERFAPQLRALGQALEKFSFSAFELRIENEIYLVTAKPTPPEHKIFSVSRFVGECLRLLSSSSALTGAESQVELRFTPEEIERFDLRGKSQRSDPDAMPDPCSTSQLLRGAGFYLESQNAAKEIRISVEERGVMVCYQTYEGRLVQAQHNVEYFYDYWVKMYMHRSNRPKPPPPSKPTVLVTWRGIQNA